MKDYESKRKLAIIFTDNYPSLVEDYLRDDQEREACVMSLSVQIFTVPSLALYLMEHHDAMSKLIQGFLNMLKVRLTIQYLQRPTLHRIRIIMMRMMY